MNMFDIKEIFLQNISDILVILICTHFGIVMFSFVAEWIHPYLKNYADMHDNIKTKSMQQFSSKKYKSIGNKVLQSDSNDGDSSDDEYLNFIDKLQSRHDASSISAERLNHLSSNENVLNRVNIGMKTCANLNTVKDKYKRIKCSSEVQTNVTINPNMKIEYSCPELMMPYFSSKIPLHTTVSSDSFESASSGYSDKEQTFSVEREYTPILRHLGCCDILKEKRNYHNSVTRMVNSVVGECSKMSYRSFSVKTDLVDLFNDSFENKISKENKILEVAINEFERELKPIREQINLLKKCLKGLDQFDTQFDSFPSDFSSSVTGTLGQSECLSEAISTTCSTELLMHGCITSRPTFTEKCTPLHGEIKFNKMGKVTKGKSSVLLSNNDCKWQNVADKYSNTIHKKAEHLNEISSELLRDKKRSPLAEMYIKLSQCSSDSTSLLIKKPPKVMTIKDDKNVTCQIKLNVTLDTTSGVQKMDWPKERDIQPVLSEPEDVIGKASVTHVSLRSVKHS